MSMFGLGGGQPAGGSSMQLEMATAELDMITDTFNKLVSSCHSKCIHSYHEPDLNKGEGVCIDRCVSKFFSVNQKVGAKMSAMGNAQGGAQPAQGGGGGLFGR